MKDRLQSAPMQAQQFLSDWHAYFRMQTKKYISHGYAQFRANQKCIENRGYDGSSALDALKAQSIICHWPKVKLDDIRRGSNDLPLLIEREKQVSRSHRELQQRRLFHLGAHICGGHAI